jgi:phage baseplate assembly protein gpV
MTFDLLHRAPALSRRTNPAFATAMLAWQRSERVAPRARTSIATRSAIGYRALVRGVDRPPSLAREAGESGFEVVRGVRPGDLSLRSRSTMAYEQSKGINGVVWGVVMDNKHPAGEFKVKCKLPWVLSSEDSDDADYTTGWCSVLTPMAGNKRGFYCLPEKEDMVLLAFVHGNPKEGVVIGSSWNTTDLAPHGDAAPADTEDPMGNAIGIADAATDSTDDKNNYRAFVSRAGSMMMFDDTEGKEKITFKTAKGTCVNLNDEKETISIYDHSGEVYLHMDKANKKITLESKEGDIDIFCKKGTLNIEAKYITTYTEKDQTHIADGTWEQESGGTMDLTAGGNMTAEAPKIDLNP